MTRTRVTLLITGGLLVGLTACGNSDSTTVSSTAAETTVVAAGDPVSTSTAPAATSPATTSVTTVAASASSVAVNGANSSTTAATSATTATTSAPAKPDLSGVLALINSAEKSAASVDKELNTANNAINSTEQDPQP